MEQAECTFRAINPSLTGIYADDGYTINVQPGGVTFDSPEHYAHQHPVVDLTQGMRPGLNKLHPDHSELAGTVHELWICDGYW